jgi:hypothetical protein
MPSYHLIMKARFLPSVNSLIWAFLWIGVMPVAADLSDEATALNVRLKESDEVEVFQAFEDWVFEKGLDEEERKERVREALVILPYPWSRSRHALHLERFQKRLVQRFAKSWWAWEAAAST